MSKTRRTASMLAVVVGAVSFVQADTLTWSGGALGKFSEAANWTGDGTHVSPQPGDTVKFPAAVTLAAESFDIGSAGLTIENAANLVTSNNFTGAGKIVKKGAGTWLSRADSAFTGGLKVENGIISLDTLDVPYGFGHGEIELVRYSTTRPYFDFGSYWCRKISANFRITGEILGGAGCIFAHNQATLDGTVTSDSDLRIRQQYGDLTINGAISAPGHTLTLEHNSRQNSNGPLKCKETIDANVVVRYWRFTKAQGSTVLTNEQCAVELVKGTTNPDNSLTVESGTNTLSTTAVWAGTNVLVKAEGARLVLTAAQNLTAQTMLKVEVGGKVDVRNGVRVRVGRFVAGTTEMPAGVYTAANLPNAIAGNGSIVVRGYTWKGGTSGLWSVASNWQPEGVPGAGDLAIFASITTNEEETVTLAAGDPLVIENANTLCSWTKFTGPGSIVKRGVGNYAPCVQSDFTGGLTVEDGRIVWGARYKAGTSVSLSSPFGAGPITFSRSSMTATEKPAIYFNEYGPGITNDIFIVNGLTNGDGVVYASNYAFCKGKITADSDFLIKQQFSKLTLGEISAPGHVVYMQDNCRNAADNAIICEKTVNASVVVRDWTYPSNPPNTCGRVTFNAVNSGVDNTLTVESGTNEFTTAASWAGTNILVKSNARLVLKAAANLSKDAELTLEAGGLLEIGNMVIVRVKKLVVGGVTMPDGYYGPDELPGVVVNSTGKLLVASENTHFWTGGTTGGDWNDPDNWEDGRVPGPGSTVVFDRAVTIGAQGSVQTVDFGAQGMTVRVQSAATAVTLYVGFSGTGKLVFDGSGFCYVNATSTHTGGTEIRRGTVIPLTQSADCLGSGPIDIYRGETESTASLRLSGWGGAFSNQIRVHGSILGRSLMQGKPFGGSIAASNNSALNGAISCDTNMLISQCYGNLPLRGSLTVPNDCTVTLLNGNDGLNASANFHTMTVACPVAGNLTFDGNNEIVLSGTGTVESCTFTAQSLTNVIAASGVWTGTNVVVQGAGSVLFLQGNGNFRDYAKVSVAADTMIDIAQGVKVRVAELRVNGETKPEGVYSAKNLSGYLSGKGSLCVGRPGVVIIFR